jgi:hypothetical protein
MNYLNIDDPHPIKGEQNNNIKKNSRNVWRTGSKTKKFLNISSTKRKQIL